MDASYKQNTEVHPRLFKDVLGISHIHISRNSCSFFAPQEEKGSKVHNLVLCLTGYSV